MFRLITFIALLLIFTASTARAITVQRYCMDSQEAQMIGLINAYRAEHGLPSLASSQTLGAAAEHHSASMARYDYVSHTLIPEGITWSRNLKNHGYTYTTYRGENIAAGRSSARDTLQQWKRSPTHNAVLLSTHYKALGVGRAYDESSRYGWYWTLDVGGVRDGRAVRC